MDFGTKTPKGKNLLRRIKVEIILEGYDKTPRGKKCATVCKKLDEELGDELLNIDPTLKDWIEWTYVGALKNQPQKVKSWISMVHSRAIKTS